MGIVPPYSNFVILDSFVLRVRSPVGLLCKRIVLES